MFISYAINLSLLGFVAGLIRFTQIFPHSYRPLDTAATSLVIMSVAATGVKDDPIIQIPIQNKIDGEPLDSRDDNQVFVTKTILLELEEIRIVRVDETLVFLSDTAESPLSFLEISFAISNYSINFKQNTVNVFSIDWTAGTVLAIALFTDTLTHFIFKQNFFF